MLDSKGILRQFWHMLGVYNSYKRVIYFLRRNRSSLEKLLKAVMIRYVSFCSQVATCSATVSSISCKIYGTSLCILDSFAKFCPSPPSRVILSQSKLGKGRMRK